MKTIFIVLYFFYATTVFGQSHYVHLQQNNLVDSTGKVVKLKGVNLGGWLLWEGWIWGAGFKSETDVKAGLKQLLPPADYAKFLSDYYSNFITEDDIALLAKGGFNCVRLPFNHRLFTAEAGADGGFPVLDNLIGWCRKYGVYVVLDMHAAPGGQSNYFIADPDKTNLWKNTVAQQQTIFLWKRIAERYKNEAAIAGYDLLNEPDTKPVDLVAMYRSIIAGIRSVDANHLLIAEGYKLAHSFSGLPAALDSNQIYSFHIYTWFSEGKKAAALKEILKDLPSGRPVWCGEWGEDKIENLKEVKALLDATPTVCGTAFWTWKRVYKNNNNVPLCTVQSAPAWNRLATWIDWKIIKPRQEEVQKGMAEFIAAIRVGNCKVNESVWQAVLQ